MHAPDINGFAFDWTFLLAFFWGLLVLAALIGWGQIISSWLLPNHREKDFGWGVEAAWGMAAFLVLSGPMLMFSLFGSPFLALFLLVGLISAAAHFRLFWKKNFQIGPSNPKLKLLVIGLLLVVGLTYAGAVATHWYNCYDDFEAYFTFSKTLLDTGTLCDPFSFRRLGSLGGQPLLGTLVVAFLPWKYAHMLDMGIAGLVLLGLMQGMVPGNGNRHGTVRLFLVALALTFPMPRSNTASEYTGVVLFFAILRSLDLVSSKQAGGWRAACLLGGVMTSAATLRCHNVFMIAALGAAYAFWRFWESRQDWRSIAREALMTLGLATLFLLPWWVVAYQSSRTFLYPLIKGTMRPEFETFNRHLPLLETLRFVGGFFVLTTYLLLYLPVLFLEPGRQRRWLLLAAAIFLLMSMAFLSQYTIGDYSDLSRYLVPIGLAFGLYTIGLVANQSLVPSRPEHSNLRVLRADCAAFLVMIPLLGQISNFSDVSAQNIYSIERALNARSPILSFTEPAFPEVVKPDYDKAFTQIPKGGKILAAVDYPYLFDYRAHQIFNVDVAGAASPDPGLPYYKGAQAVKDYLLAQGIHYIAHVPFENGLYMHSRAHEGSVLHSPIATASYYAPFELDLYKNVDELEKTNRILYDSPFIRVVDLGGP